MEGALSELYVQKQQEHSLWKMKKIMFAVKSNMEKSRRSNWLFYLDPPTISKDQSLKMAKKSAPSLGPIVDSWTSMGQGIGMVGTYRE